MNLIDVGEFNGRMLYTAFRLDYRLWALTSASRTISEVAELLISKPSVLYKVRETNKRITPSFSWIAARWQFGSRLLQMYTYCNLTLTKTFVFDILNFFRCLLFLLKSRKYIVTIINPLKPNSSNCYTMPYRPNQPFSISDIRALWRSALSARVSECQKLKMAGYAFMALNIRNVTIWWHSWHWALKG